MLHKLCLVIFVCFAITGCSSKFKQKIGLVTAGPDEYQVRKYKSLEVPPHYELKAPIVDKKVKPAKAKSAKKKKWLFGK